MEISNNPSLQTLQNPTNSTKVETQQNAAVIQQQPATQSDRVTLSAEALQKLSAEAKSTDSGGQQAGTLGSGWGNELGEKG